MRLIFSEIFDQVNKANKKEDKLALLKQHDSLPLQQLLQYNFSDRIKFVLPAGPVPYKKDPNRPIGKTSSNLLVESRKFWHFISEQNPEGVFVTLSPNLTRAKREILFIQILEGIHHSDADILIAVKDKSLQDMYPTITKKLVAEAYKHDPLFPESVEEDVAPKKDFGVTLVDQVTPSAEPKVKKPASQKRLDALARARQVRSEKIAQKKLLESGEETK